MPRALIVEDAVEIQEIVTALLRDEGFDVRSASDGERAIEMARAFEPDLIVLDLSLPGLEASRCASASARSARPTS